MKNKKVLYGNQQPLPTPFQEASLEGHTIAFFVLEQTDRKGEDFICQFLLIHRPCGRHTLRWP